MKSKLVYLVQLSGVRKQ